MHPNTTDCQKLLTYLTYLAAFISLCRKNVYPGDVGGLDSWTLRTLKTLKTLQILDPEDSSACQGNSQH